MSTKFIPVLAVLSIALSGCSVLQKGLGSLNQAQLASAAGNAFTALTITDAQIAELCAQTIEHLDATNTIDNGSYTKRLNNLLANVGNVEGIKFNYKVYITSEVNAFATGDGSIRVYSGLMDIMDDDELIAIIGHEIGHVVHKDSKTAMQKAYLASAARDVISSAGGIVGTLSQSVLGDLAQSFLDAQFSQKQEYAADEYGYKFAIEQGHDKYSMYNSLNALLELSSGSQSSKVAQMFASHPGTAERAQRVKEMADSAK